MNNNNELMIIKLLCFRTVRCFRIILYFSNIPWNYYVGKMYEVFPEVLTEVLLELAVSPED